VATEKRERQRANRELRNQQVAKVVSRRRFTKRLLIGGGVAVGLLLFVLLLAWFGNRGSSDDTSSTTATTTATTTAAASFAYGTGECPPAQVTTPVKTFTAAPKLCIDPTKTYNATIVTDHGNIGVKLDPVATPGTVNNFVVLARYGYYDDTKIFRAAQSIDIIQGGGNSNTDSPGYTIPDEGSGYTYEAGDLAMARTPAPNSAGAQWFITTGPNSSNLDAAGTYVKFGTITEGLDVAQNILALANSPTDDTLKEPVVVQRIEITET
jgi:cyclophilin family peptidyl-prolyl cis-trans isomerase